ncbi:hypothetical protein G7046_g6054 [Stylonectria norvegica]|nr:hypothetical protein G7046_g6054 [Stylonectria norvegica]
MPLPNLLQQRFDCAEIFAVDFEDERDADPANLCSDGLGDVDAKLLNEAPLHDNFLLQFTTSVDSPPIRPSKPPLRPVTMAHMNVKPDPAYLKLQAMQQNRHKFFRWTPRTAKITFVYVFLVPSIMGYIAYRTDGLWDFRAKRKGDLIYEK